MTRHRKSRKDRAQTPFPGKQDILRFIAESPERVGKREIARAFHIRGDDRIRLKKLLKEMREEGLLAQGHGKSLERAGELPPVTVIEVVGTDEDGHAIGRPTSWDDEAPPPHILVHEPKFGPAMGKGERALVRLTRLSADLYEATIMRRLEQAAPLVLGHFTIVDGEGRVTPVAKKARTYYTVTKEHRNGARDGDLVMAEPIRGRRRSLGPRPVRIRESLASLDEPRAISLIAIHAHDIPLDFPRDALAEAEAARPVELGTRTDLRDIPLITVDPADARDHDDAIWAEPDPDPNNKGGWHVIVAIADVAHYVRPGSALDIAARQRGNSVYFPDRVVPMLPEALSADLCSLMPGEDRACMAVHMWFDADGEMIRHKFVRALMRSAANLSYEEFQAAHDGNPGEDAAPLVDSVIKPLFGAYRALAKARAARQPLDIEMPERKIELAPDGKVVAIRERERLDAHKLVENFMIAANVAAAETLEARRQPCMYRVHEEPALDKVAALREFLGELGFNLAKAQVLRPAVFNRVLERAIDTPHKHVVNEMVLRTQSQAYYSAENLGHFGLSLRRYAHFTSPIRRYADVLVHRALISGLKLGPDGLSAEDRERFEETGEHISATERRAMAAERDSVDRYLAAYLEDRVGATFAARISSVTRFGLFVSLEESGADGLIPLSSLNSDYFHHNAAHHRLEGEHTGRIYALGDRVQVRLLESSGISGAMRFELLEDTDAERPSSRRSRATRTRRKASGNAKRGAKGKRRPR
ncbi:MAG: ribonuclease R [Alphaproteobacteria bacterium]|nr:MAG: ribonuclease R [Alphaproteobacteria bacterium]